MFTGLVESTGKIVQRTPLVSGSCLEISVPFAAELAIGESVAVSGVCLTVVRKTLATFSVDVSTETEARSTLATLPIDALVNLERALLPSHRMGGHFVSGHVDAVGEIVSIENTGDFHRIAVLIPESYAPLVIEKGSVAIDGISLTINALSEQSLELMLIPHTWKETNAQLWRVGSTVNLEFDMIAKQVQKLSEIYLRSMIPVRTMPHVEGRSR